MTLIVPAGVCGGTPTEIHSSFDRPCDVNTRQAHLASGVRIHTQFLPQTVGGYHETETGSGLILS